MRNLQLCFYICVGLFCGFSWSQAKQLPILHVDTNAISVSGISAGAMMATQLHIAFSETFMGAGLIGGGPYLCPPQIWLEEPSLIDVPGLVSQVFSLSSSGNIDPISNLAHDRIWLFAGMNDTFVPPVASVRAEEFYLPFVERPEQVKLVDHIQAAHGQVTNNYGGICEEFNVVLLNNCNYSAAYHLLNHIYGNMKEPSPDDKHTEELILFDQTPFTTSFAMMDDLGYLYVPKSCQDGTIACKLHLAFHGCYMGRELLGDLYAGNSGYNEVADLNDIIVVYPQTRGFNGTYCWDFSGYTGVNYGFKSGQQAQTIHQMVRHLSGMEDYSRGEAGRPEPMHFLIACLFIFLSLYVQ